MIERDGDDRLRAEFQRLRAVTEAAPHVPDFEGLLERARSEAITHPPLEVVVGAGGAAAPRGRGRATRMGGWAAAAVAAVATAVLLTDVGADPDAEFERLVAAYARDAAAGAWRSPTSGLLDVPGIELVRSVPAVGSSLRGAEPARRPAAPPRDGRDS